MQAVEVEAVVVDSVAALADEVARLAAVEAVAVESDEVAAVEAVVVVVEADELAA